MHVMKSPVRFFRNSGVRPSARPTAMYIMGITEVHAPVPAGSPDRPAILFSSASDATSGAPTTPET